MQALMRQRLSMALHLQNWDMYDAPCSCHEKSITLLLLMWDAITL
jgi:hypothetical protein